MAPAGRAAEGTARPDRVGPGARGAHEAKIQGCDGIGAAPGARDARASRIVRLGGSTFGPRRAGYPLIDPAHGIRAVPRAAARPLRPQCQAIDQASSDGRDRGRRRPRRRPRAVRRWAFPRDPRAHPPPDRRPEDPRPSEGPRRRTPAARPLRGRTTLRNGRKTDRNERPAPRALRAEPREAPVPVGLSPCAPVDSVSRSHSATGPARTRGRAADTPPAAAPIAARRPVPQRMRRLT